MVKIKHLIKRTDELNLTHKLEELDCKLTQSNSFFLLECLNFVHKSYIINRVIRLFKKVGKKSRISKDSNQEWSVLEVNNDVIFHVFTEESNLRHNIVESLINK